MDKMKKHKIRKKLINKYNNTCFYCGGATKDMALEIEHIHPRSKGGSNSITNLTLACHTCNQQKADLTLDEWYSLLVAQQDSIYSAIRRKKVKVLMKIQQNNETNCQNNIFPIK